MTRTRNAPLLSIATTLLIGLGAGRAHADTVVQIQLPDVLDGRSVTTLTAGQLVTWDLPTDGGGLQNAFATNAAAAQQGFPAGHALPDDGIFPADTRHPEVVLNFSNTADAAAFQTHVIAPLGMITFPVPPATYSKLFLFFNGAAGGTTLTITLTFTDGMQTEMAMVPDYYADVSTTDPVIFNLATDLAKWDNNNQISEAGHHNITGVELNPMPTKMLTSVQVARNADGALVFWGATGIATSDVAGLGGAGGSGSGGVGGGGGGGAGGTASGGTAGGANAGGGAGGSTSAAGGAGGGAGTPTAGTAGATTSVGGTSSPGGGAGGTATTATGGSVVTPSAPTSSSSSGCQIGGIAGVIHESPLWALAAASALYLGRKRRR